MVEMRLKMPKMRLKMARLSSKMAKMRLKVVKMRLKMAKMRLKMAKMRLEMTKMRPKMAKMRLRTKFVPATRSSPTPKPTRCCFAGWTRCRPRLRGPSSRWSSRTRTSWRRCRRCWLP